MEEKWILWACTICIPIIIFFIGFCSLCAIKNWHKRKLLMIEQVNEQELQRISWTHKMLWEEKIAENNKLADGIRKNHEDLERKVNELWKKRDEISQLDLNRIALLHLLLSGSKEALTPKTLEQEVNKIKESYEIIKDYVK